MSEPFSPTTEPAMDGARLTDAAAPVNLLGLPEAKLVAFFESIGEKNKPMEEGFFAKAKRFFEI